ncbi:gag-protease polyprotein [Trifolium pratense]|uniref:Gag-protease polyprotein n=2 Tax=Trifolium pratense TaxID=57577 RepID=A0A2K3NUT4_TRIPR|nr:gag-protease polyprotein [Trifolium pratense]PNY06799.1 gag-protease polyprotein [Trifolium pratense]
MTATWSDSESEEEKDDKALTGTFETISLSSEDLNGEELEEKYKEMVKQCEESCLLIKEQEKIIKGFIQEKEELISTVSILKEELFSNTSTMKEEKEELLSIVSTPKEEVTLLDSKLTNMTKTVRMMNKGTEILDAGKRAGDMKGIGFDNNYNIKVKAAPKKTFPPKKRLQEQMFHQMSQHHLQQQSRKKSQHHVQQKNMKSDKMSQHHAQQRSRMMSQHPAQHKNMKCDNMSQHHVQHRSSHHKDNKEPTKRCRYCRGHGHMRSECFKIHGYPHKVKTPRSN